MAYQRRAGVAIVLADPLGPAGDPRRVRHASSSDAPSAPASSPASSARATRRRRPCRRAGAVSWSPTTRSSTCPVSSSPASGGTRCAPRSTAPAREEVTFRMTRLARRAVGRPAAAARDLGDVGRRQGPARDGLHARHARRGGGSRGAARARDLRRRATSTGSCRGCRSTAGTGRVRGWTLDLMRRRDGGFGPVMEFLIGSSAKHFSDEGAEIMSLSGAPLAHDYPPDAGRDRRCSPSGSPSCSSRSTGSGRCTASRRSSTRATRRCTCCSATRAI